jgi:hypothetical protein
LTKLSRDNAGSTLAAGNEYGVAGELHELASSSEGDESIREAIAEHREPALRLGFRRFVLKHIVDDVGPQLS